MFEIALDNLPFVIVLVVLAGSLLGSTIVYVSRGGAQSGPADDGYASTGFRRPADWPSRQTEVPVYDTSEDEQDRSSTRRSALPAILFVTGLAFVGGSAGMFAYKSAWPVGTDLRHLAATLHCDLAERVGMAPSYVGSPGYHIRNDRDRNGIACETYAAALDLAQGPVAPGDRLSTTRLAWPSGSDAAVAAPGSQ